MPRRVRTITFATAALVLAAALAHLLVSDRKTPPAGAAVRDLPADFADALPLPPALWGDVVRSPPEGGADALTGPVDSMLGAQGRERVRHESALDWVALAAARAQGEARAPLAQSLVRWLYRRVGVTALPLAVRAHVATGVSARAELGRLLVEEAGRLPPGPLVYGVARVRVSGLTWAQALVIGYEPVRLDPFPRRVSPGEPMVLSGRLREPVAEDLRVRVRGRAWSEDDLPLGADEHGRFRLGLQAPVTPGECPLEISTPEPPLLVRGAPAPVAVARRLLQISFFVFADEPVHAPEWITQSARESEERVESVRARLAVYDAVRRERRLHPLTYVEHLVEEADRFAALHAEGRPPSDSEVGDAFEQASTAVWRVLQSSGAAEGGGEAAHLNLWSASHRRFLFDPATTAIVVGVAPRPDGPPLQVEFLLQPVPTVQPGLAARSLFEAVNLARKRSGGQPFAADAALDEVAGAFAGDICSGARKPDEQAEVQRRVAARGLRALPQTFVVSQRYLPDAAVDGAFAVVKAQGGRLGVGVCQGLSPGPWRTQTAVFVVMPADGAAGVAGIR